MYVHQHQLEHLLRPRHYTDPDFFRQELETLFEPAWHLIGTVADIPRPGDYRTTELLGRPLIVRNTGDRIQVYENVCAHRHCMLTDSETGHMERLKCQYHGWEYDDQGRTGQIPDARCFRPFDRDNAHLRLFPTETVGELIFVSLDDDPPELRDYLGGHYRDLFAESFGGDFQQCWRWSVRFKANWKVPIENTLEMYHLPCLHSKTFGRYAEEETCTHVLEDDSTTLHTLEYHPVFTKISNWMLRRIGRVPTNGYTHHHVHPNFVYIGMDSMRMAEAFVPISPTETEQRVWLYAVRGKRNNPLAWVNKVVFRKVVRSVTRQILNEDLPIFEDVQRGMKASRHPGVIGTLEERIFAFQKYLLGRIEGAPLPLETVGT